VYRCSYPVFGQICRWHAVHVSSGGVVGQVDSQHHRQHQDTEETEQQYPGPGHPHPVTAGERAAAATAALLQRLVPPTGPGHGCGWCRSVCPSNSYVSKPTCAGRKRNIHTGSGARRGDKQTRGKHQQQPVQLLQHTDPSLPPKSLSADVRYLNASPAAQFTESMADFEAILIKFCQISIIFHK